VRPAKPLDLQTVVRTFEAIPELVTAGAFGGANALYLEHIENPFERFSLDIDLQNQSEEIESVHHRLSVHKGLRLVSRPSVEMYEYETRVANRVVRIEIAKPYLRHRTKYQPSKHVPGLLVVSLADLAFAKLSAFSTGSFARDLIDLFAIDRQREIDWLRLLARASRASDNDYNPSQFHQNLQWHRTECGKASYEHELPVKKPPTASALREFVSRLMVVNQVVARQTLK